MAWPMNGLQGLTGVSPVVKKKKTSLEIPVNCISTEDLFQILPILSLRTSPSASEISTCPIIMGLKITWDSHSSIWWVWSGRILVYLNHQFDSVTSFHKSPSHCQFNSETLNWILDINSSWAWEGRSFWIQLLLYWKFNLKVELSKSPWNECSKKSLLQS